MWRSLSQPTLQWSIAAPFNMRFNMASLLFRRRTDRQQELDVALLDSVSGNNRRGVRDLIRLGANVNAMDNRSDLRWSETVLMRACCRGHLDVVRELLKLDRLDVNAKSRECQWTALIAATLTLRLDVVRELVKDERVDVNAKDGQSWTALMAASRFGNWELIRALLKHDKVDVNAVDMEGCTALHMICASGKAGFDEFLKHEKIKVNGFDELLKHEKIKVNIQDFQGRTAFYMASSRGHWGIVEAMMTCDDIDVNCRGPLGYTALFWACLGGRLDAVSMLLKHGTVDASIKSKAGSTALDVARNLQMLEIVKCLEDHAHRL